MDSIIKRYSNLPVDIDLVFRSLCALLSEQPEKVDWSGFTRPEWDLFGKIAVEENVAPMAYYLLRTKPGAYHRSEFDQATYQALADREAVFAVRNAVMFKRLDEILQVFTKHEIPVVLLKGADLARSLYPEPGLRWLTDLDLLVQEENTKQALSLVHRLGYHEYLPEAFPGLDRLLSYHTHMLKDGRVPVLLELHWSLVGSDAFRYAVSMDWFWHNLGPRPAWGGKAIPGDQNYVHTLNPTASLLYLSAHQMLQHGGELASLYWLLDIHRLIHYRREEIDWKTLAEQANSIGWSMALKAALQAVMQTFNTQLPEGFISSLQVGGAANGSLVELKSKQAPTHILGEWKKIKLFNRKGQILLLLALVFPSPSYMRWRYDPHPEWILPIYYIFRWVGIFWDGMRTLIQILAMY